VVDGTGRPDAPDEEDEDLEGSATTEAYFPRALSQWITTNRDLVDALGSLRRVGVEAAPALDGLLGLRSIQRVRLSWQLWAALLEGDGEEPENRLLEVVPVEVLDRTRDALWGSPWGQRSQPGA
jgi:hypothetical protein